MAISAGGQPERRATNARARQRAMTLSGESNKSAYTSARLANQIFLDLDPDTLPDIGSPL
jgi:hypothetical protein